MQIPENCELVYVINFFDLEEAMVFNTIGKSVIAITSD